MADFNDIHAEEGAEAVEGLVNDAAPVKETIHDAVERLAALHPLEYEQVRKAEAEKLSVDRISVLDDAVKKKRSTDNSTEEQPVGLQEAEPWHEPVDGWGLFQALTGVFKKYLVLQPYQAEALALWSIFSYCIDANNIAPKLLIHSPEKRCGKTTLLDVLHGVVYKPLPASNISTAAVFRAIDFYRPTVVIDEADTFIKQNPEMHGIINSGHRKSMSQVVRCDGDDHEPKWFSTWAPMVIAMIGKPHDTLVDRSILIEMKRKKPGDNVQRLVPHKAETEFKILASKIARWKDDNFIALCEADPETPDGLNDRAADNWRPLLAIADLIGIECGEIARVAAIKTAETESDEDDGSAGVMLLADIRDIFESERHRTRIATEDLLHKLHEMEDRPWPEWNRGKEITAAQVARQLKPFGIKSKTLRTGYGSKAQKGYMLEHFQDAFDRYLVKSSVTALQINDSNGSGDISKRNTAQNVTDEIPVNVAENIDCYGVTDTKG